MNFKRVGKGVVLAAAMAAAFASAGCGAKKQPPKKEITELQRKEAAHLASEADFAITVRQWERAEGLLAKAAELCPDTPEYWITLGTVRVRHGNRSGAKSAYETALAVYETDAGESATDSEPWLQQVYVLALLGRVDDARARLDKAAKQFPNDRAVRAFIEQKRLDAIVADPTFKQIAL